MLRGGSFYSKVLEILIFFPLTDEEAYSQQHGHAFCHHDGQSHAVDAEKLGQNQHRRHLEHQRPQEGD